MNLYIGSDHAGYHLKKEIKKYLDAKEIKYEDLGNHEYDPDDDYPDYGYKVAEAVAKDPESKGILICGTSFGVCIVANKVKGIRAVNICNEKEARISREHNDANVLCLSGGKTKENQNFGIEIGDAIKIIEVWLNTDFSGEERHIRRVGKIERH